VSGIVAGFYNQENEVPYFTILGGLAILVGAGLLLSVKPVLKLMRGVR
jgi:POT family proton-dependent oligopeptide transporter